jgi:phosphoribosylformylglycinamidine synthase
VPGDAFTGLYSESTARAVVTTRDAAGLTELAARHGVPLTRLGTTGGTDLVVEGWFSVPVEEVRAAWAATLPAALG